MQDLDILHMPLSGFRLIEASAGTGKTHNLIIIYLRLLLNLKENSNLSYPLTVKEILVVTFTQSAAQELYIRIKHNIKHLKLDCIKGYSNNYLFSKLLSKIDNINAAINILSIAEQEIDQSSIFTIHGFCQKVLIENKIELNILFHTSIIENTLPLYRQICFDLWRRHFYSLPLNIVSFIKQFWNSPEDLLNDILPYIYGKTPKFKNYQFIHESNKNISTFYFNIINCIDNIKIKWIETQHNITNNIHIFNLHHKIYNKSNLSRWIQLIDQWAREKTLDHSIPNCLERFRLSVLQTDQNLKYFYISSVYYKIEELYQRLSLFPALIFNIAIYEIRQNLNKSKYIRSKITFNDLIDILLHHISENNKLSKKILQKYPVAIIDEFQDTDLNQYKIFQKLYSNQSKNNSLILIGDPKQAIYGFRGADIFTYMKVRKLLLNRYNLNINWRSSPGMVNAINQLFQISNPFIFKDIPFIPLRSAYQNSKYKFYVHNKPQQSICFWLHPDSTVTIHNYKIAMIKECINSIQNLLYNIHYKTAWLENNKYKKKILQQSDIAILVRTHEEAMMIRSELLKKDIPTIFLSNRKNIFETIEAYELLLLLESILFPNQHTICTALTTIFFGLKATKIEKINNKSTPQWEIILGEFSEYYLLWEKHGILSMIQKIIFRYKIPEKLLSIKSGKNSLINILQLGEILNKIAQQLRTKYALIQWFKLKIHQPSNQNELSSEYTLQYNDTYDLIKITTIHQSKGLEFPITFLPFIANFRYNKKILFHDRKLFELYLDFDKSSKYNLKLSDEERLADDLRLLYVAITRSIYHCSIGIAPIVYKSRKNLCNITDLHHSAIGYLVQNKKPSTGASLKKYLYDLNTRSKGDIVFHPLSNKKEFLNFFEPISNQLLSSKKWNPTITQKNNNKWHITSYSELKRSHETKNNNNPHSNSQDLQKFIIYDNFQDKKNNFTILTKHNFPKGKMYGDFFHSLLKNLDFKKSIDIPCLKRTMILYNIDVHWLTIIKQWIYTIINTPLNQNNFTLSKINNKDKKTEFKFYLNINTTLTALDFNHICKHYDPISCISPMINFETITGMLQGFIDLIFLWNKKYYLLDYKTNWLGDNNHFYIQPNIKSEIIKHRYDLQYQIYTIALHRFLKYQIASYNYNKNFGGIYYLFIRGLNGLSSNNGVYFYYPRWEFIKKLDNLF